MDEKKEKVIIEGNAFYEIDLECQKKKEKEARRKKQQNKKRQRK